MDICNMCGEDSFACDCGKIGKGFTFPIKYKVMRTVMCAREYKIIKEEKIWEGTDPSRYKGGEGTFDEGDIFIFRQFYVKTSPYGDWAEISDPR